MNTTTLTAATIDPLLTLDEVREVLGAILPLTGWLPPSGPYRVYEKLSAARGNPDEAREYLGSNLQRA